MTSIIVKSTARTFEVLELFAQRQAPLSAKQIEETLGYPASSTLMLLKSMSKLGYLRFDRLTHTYLPTMRVVLLGEWMKSSPLASEAVLRATRELNELVGETVFISAPNHTTMQTVYFLLGRQAINLTINLDFTVDTVNSAAGLAYLATLTPGQVDDIIEHTSRGRGGQLPFAPDVIRKKVEEVRKQGYAAVYDVLPSVGSITMAIPSPYSETQHILGIGGLSERVRANEKQYVKDLSAAIDRIRKEIMP